MKLTQKELEVLIDNFLKEDSDLLREDYQKKVLLEQPSGVNTMMSWRYPGVGDECKLNIDQILTNKLGMEPKPAKNINDALSFILSRFIGLNSWMCDIVNIGLGVPRDTGDEEKEKLELTLTNYFDKYSVEDWKSIYNKHKIKDLATFKSNFVSKIIDFKLKAGIKSGEAAKDPRKVSEFVKLLHTGTGIIFGQTKIFDVHLDGKDSIREIQQNLRKETKSGANYANDIIDSISSACADSLSLEALREIPTATITAQEIKKLFDPIKK